MSIRSVMGVLGFAILGALATACGGAPDGEPTGEGEAAVAKGGGGGDKTGQACHVTSGPNSGKSGTYTNDVDGLNCAGSWGSTGCTGPNGTSKCSDGAKIVHLPPPVTPPPVGGVFTQ